jgi:predicted nucleotidyltransferase
MNTEIEEVISGLAEHFESQRIGFLIVGAQARDIILEKSNLPASPRKTADVDFGILVENWDALNSLRESFKSNVNIRESSNKENKTRYTYKGTLFDLVPFGKGIEKDGKVSWPPFYDTIITVTGYQEALDSAEEFEFNGRKVKVVSPEMLVALKLVSWNENRSRDRDAKDIINILTNFGRIDNNSEEYVFDNYSDIPKKFDYEMGLAVISLVGIRIKAIASKEHIKLIKILLENEEDKRKLTRSMIPERAMDIDKNESDNIKILDSLLFGINYSK